MQQRKHKQKNSTEDFASYPFEHKNYLFLQQNQPFFISFLKKAKKEERERVLTLVMK